MALDQPAHSNDVTPDGGQLGMFDNKPTPEKNMLQEVEDTIDQHVLGGGMAAYGDLIGAGKNNVHTDAAVERDPQGNMTGLDFGKVENVTELNQRNNQFGHAGLYALMRGQGDNVHQMAGDVAEKKLMANV